MPHASGCVGLISLQACASNRVAVLDGDSGAQSEGERWTAVGAEPASPSPSKHGLWSTLLGGLRGMVIPPKVTPHKLAVLKSAVGNQCRNREAGGCYRFRGDV
jgi:hypothetical protein